MSGNTKKVLFFSRKMNTDGVILTRRDDNNHLIDIKICEIEFPDGGEKNL